MLFIEEGVVYITRGDDAVLNVGITMDGESYAMQEGDVLTLTVRGKPDDEAAVLLQAQSLPGTSEIPLVHDHTSLVEPGQYSADIQLNTQEGQRITIWPQPEGSLRYKAKNFKNFVIMPEVTMQ